MPIARHGSDGLASHAVPSDTSVSLKNKSLQNQCHAKVGFTFHAKSKTRIGCWNVRTLGALSGQSKKLRSVLRTMKEKRIEILAMSESHWPGQGITKVQSYTILYSGTPSSHVHGIALALSPNAQASWKVAVILCYLRSYHQCSHKDTLHLCYHPCCTYMPQPTQSTA